ncbi:hypothetical protein MmiHf6_02280 [Methanimicrococcus hongohii]|uniref:Uncharacterized protein n=1 Tax=Methanimicrococcus hongohii TaxID=3028295 RepID=A0AA96UYI4_9EURY|nr:hypothetical protein MmiHf6_02280 [Methanimicrococcus sp. Hf6]
MVPLSTEDMKYRSLMNKMIQTGGKCDKIYICDYKGKTNAFLMQNMFPITDNYIYGTHKD